MCCSNLRNEYSGLDHVSCKSFFCCSTKFKMWYPQDHYGDVFRWTTSREFTETYRRLSIFRCLQFSFIYSQFLYFHSVRSGLRRQSPLTLRREPPGYFRNECCTGGEPMITPRGNCSLVHTQQHRALDWICHMHKRSQGEPRAPCPHNF